MHGLDNLYYAYNLVRFSRKNKKFKTQHPEIAVPPPYMLYESYRLDYKTYYNDGKNSAYWVSQQLKDVISGSDRILEWGCGPARVVRHLLSLWPLSEIHACDYNQATVNWCNRHIEGVQFKWNALDPPLPYAAGFFDIIYALSVFTHLSEVNHRIWLEELNRVIKPGGILLLTTQGNAFFHKLSPIEQKQFLEGVPVIRGRVKEGHRTFSAFQPESYMRYVFQKVWKVVHFEKGEIQSWGSDQDTWILEKTT